MRYHLDDETKETLGVEPEEYDPTATAIVRLQNTHLWETFLSTLIMHLNTTSLEELALTDDIRRVYLTSYT